MQHMICADLLMDDGWMQLQAAIRVRHSLGKKGRKEVEDEQRRYLFRAKRQ
jgi:hypothetical protein